MDQTLDAWAAGSANWIEDWDRVGERGRAAFGALMGMGASRVALIPATSVGVGVVAAALTAEDDVVVTGDEFTSVLFPLLVARDRGVPVREVEFERLVDSFDPWHDPCRLLPRPDADPAGTPQSGRSSSGPPRCVLLDATQGIPFVPLGDLVDRIDYLVCSAYKHLLCPRGVAFMALRGDHVGWRRSSPTGGRPTPVRPLGGPLTLAPAAAMYDVSLAWFPWLGAAESLELLLRWQEAGALEEPPRLARDLADGLGLPGREQPLRPG